MELRETMTDLDLAYQSATQLRGALDDRTVSSVELIENALSRIEEVNEKLNAFCFVYPDEAMDLARKADDRIANGEARGPLEGLPFALKDFTPTKGKRTTLGSKVFENWVPDYDVPIFERLRDAGGILIGKTMTPEFASSSFTASPLWGVTRNPWSPEHTPGGSSGGSAVAVVTGCVPLAEGSDGGGSIRIPAALSGCVGFKPSLGRIPLCIMPTGFEQIFHLGPLSRTVDDAALFLSVAQGPDDRDILSLPGEAPIELPVPYDVRGMKFAFSIDLGFFVVEEEVEKNTRAAVDALRDAGAVVEEVALPWEPRLADEFFTYWSVMMIACFGQYVDQWRDQMGDDFLHFVSIAEKMSAADFKKLEIYRTEVWNSLREILSRYGALLSPTMALPAPLATEREMDFGGLDENGLYKGLDMCFPFNYTSRCPVLSVPSGFTLGGLPTGLQIVGRRHDEPTVLRIGKAIERSGLHPGIRPTV